MLTEQVMTLARANNLIHVDVHSSVVRPMYRGVSKTEMIRKQDQDRPIVSPRRRFSLAW